MKWKNVLMVLSVMFGLGLLITLVMGPGQPALFISESYAQNRAVAGGGYAITTANLTSSRQALWVVDNTEKRLIIYAIASGKKKGLEPIGARDLRKDFGENLAGDLLVLPGEITSGTDAVYVVDPVGKKLIVYYCPGKGVEVVGMRDLGQDFRQ